MQKRYQVFVSSTYEDLHEERREVMQALLALNCIPTGMELFPAADDDSWTHIERFIAGCDYYILIVGGRYGSKGPSGKSYTEMEYDRAVSAEIPVLAFLHKDPGLIPANKTEPTDFGKAALASFREKIEKARHAKYWSSAGELAGTVTLGMASIMQLKPRVGWVRADLVPDEGAVQELLNMRRKIEELEKIVAEAEADPPEEGEPLAQGEETIPLHFKYGVPNGWHEKINAFTWNDLLSILGPIMIDPVSEDKIKEQLGTTFKNRYSDEGQVKCYAAFIRDEDFQRIKVQFRALGFIRAVKDQSGSRQAPKFWELTPYGDRMMTRVAAIRSSARTSPTFAKLTG